MMVETPEHQQLVRKVRWYINLRWFYLLGLSLPGLISIYIAQGPSPTWQRSAFIALAGLAYNALFFALVRVKGKPVYYKILGWTQIVSDIALTSMLVASGGGVESRMVILYSIAIVVAGAMFGPRSTFVVAALSAIFYDGIIILDYVGTIRFGEIAAPQLHGDLGYAITTIAFYTAALFIIAAVSNYVTKLLQEEEIKAKIHSDALAHAQTISHLGSWEWDIKTDKVTWSDELYRIFGVESSKFTATFQGVMQFIHPDDLPILRAKVDAAIKLGLPFGLDHKIITPDGTQRFVHSEAQVARNEYGENIKLIGTVLDTTDRTMEQQALQARTNELEKLNKLMLGREAKMVELKRKLRDLGVRDEA